MIKLLFKNRKSIFMTWLFSYILMLMIPIILCITLFGVSNKIIDQQIRSTNEVSMNYLKQSVDNNLLALKKVMLEVAWDLNINQFMMEKPPLDINKKIDIVNIVNLLKRSSTLNNMTDMLYVYFNNTDMIISSAGSFEPSDMYELNHKFDSLAYDDWKNNLKSKSYKNYHLLPYYSASGQARNGLMLTYQLPIGSWSEILGTIAVVCNQDDIVKLMKEMRYSNQSQIFILDSQNQLVSSTTGGSVPEGFDFKGLTNKRGDFFTFIDNEEYAVTYIASDVMEWKYISIIPKSLFQKQLNSLRWIAFTGLALCILFGCISAYALSQANYKKVRALTNKIEGDIYPENSNENELDFIGRYIELTEEYKKEINRKLALHNHELKEKYLSDLLYGILQENEILKESLQWSGIVFESNIFAVIIIPENSIVALAGQTDVNRKVLENVFEQKTDDKIHFYFCEIDRKIALIANILSESPRNILKAAIEQIYDAVGKEFSIKFTAAVSEIHESPFGISNAYQEALDTLEYYTVSGKDGILFYNEIVAVDSGYQEIFPLEAQQKIINCIKGRDMARAGEALDEVFEKLQSTSNISLGMGKCVMFSMINTITGALYALSNSLGHNVMDCDEQVERLLKCCSVTEMKQILYGIFEDISKQLENMKQTEKNSLIENIKKYVVEHYTDYNLNISNIADAFDMNPAYLSRIFREKTGDNLLDYINTIRLKYAKELLANPKISINKIAEMVGFISGNAFIRTYKRYEEITPGKYREILENSK